MFEQIMNMLNQHGSQTINSAAPGIPQEQHANIIEEATRAITGQMQTMQANGQTEELNQMAQGNVDPNHPAVQQAQGNFINNITSKLGIDPAMAKTLAVTLLPVLISKMMHHGNQPEQQQNGGMGGMLGSLLGRFGL